MNEADEVRQEVAAVQRQREAPVAQHHRGRWAWFVAALLLIAVLIGGLVQQHIDADRAHEDAKTLSMNQGVLNDTLMENRSVVCRQFIANGESVTEHGPCMEEGVLRYYDPETGEPIPDPDAGDEEVIILVSTSKPFDESG